MARTFTIPQFVDVESKIIGSMTVRQFFIALVGVILVFISYQIFSFVIFAIVSIVIVAIFGTIGFAKINGRPFHFFLLNFIQTSKKPELRIWNHRTQLKDHEDSKIDQVSRDKDIIPQKPSLASSRLNELSLIVDTKGIYEGEE